MFRSSTNSLIFGHLRKPFRIVVFISEAEVENTTFKSM